MLKAPTTRVAKGPGSVELIPYNIDQHDDPEFPAFDPAVGQFVGERIAEFDVVKGTGIFKGARGDIQVTATNDPFFLNEATWIFTWTVEGDFRLKGNRSYPVNQTVCDPILFGPREINSADRIMKKSHPSIGMALTI